MSDDLKSQRDRYIAFSLAAADLLIEVGADMRIYKTIGATQALLSGLANEVIGRDVCTVFSGSDEVFARRLLQRARKTGRIEPCSLHLDQGDNPPLLVNMGACFLADCDNHTFITLTVLSDMVMMTTGIDASGLHDKDSFTAVAEKAMMRANGPKEMKLVRISGLVRAMRDLPPAKADLLVSEIGACLRTQSLGGAAGRLSDDTFSYIASGKGDVTATETITKDIAAAAKAAGLPEGALQPSVINLELNTGNLDAESVTRALQYALGNFAGSEGTPAASLEQSLKAAMAETVQHFDTIRALLDGDKHHLVYQPVVKLSDRTIHHYEALLRFPDGRTPYDTIRLSEQLGLVQDFDLAVARKTIDMLNLRTDISIAINLSGSSAQNEIFRERLRQLVMPFRDISERLMFELTESEAIEDMDAAGNFLRWLRRTGFKVCLDDFGAGASTYNYLRRFDVDFVKIDGPFLREARDNPRQRALIRSVANLCRELHSEVVAEMIEDEEMARLCHDMGIGYGQGFHLGKPKAEIEAPRGAPQFVVRRRGVVEGWGR